MLQKKTLLALSIDFFGRGRGVTVCLLHLTRPWEVHSQLFCKHWFTWSNCLGRESFSRALLTKSTSLTFCVLTLNLRSCWAIPRVSTSNNSNDTDHFWTQHEQNCRLKPGLELKWAPSVQPVGFIDKNPLNVCCICFSWSMSTVWSVSNKAMWPGRKFVFLDDLLLDGHTCALFWSFVSSSDYKILDLHKQLNNHPSIHPKTTLRQYLNNKMSILP